MKEAKNPKSSKENQQTAEKNISFLEEEWAKKKGKKRKQEERRLKSTLPAFYTVLGPSSVACTGQQ